MLTDMYGISGVWIQKHVSVFVMVYLQHFLLQNYLFLVFSWVFWKCFEMYSDYQLLLSGEIM